MNLVSEQFLKALDPYADKFLFVCFNKAGQVHTFLGDYVSQAKILEGLNRKNGYDIYVTVNKTVASSRKLKQFTHARALWQEDDNSTTKLPNLPSDIVVQTSPGHFHRYWLCEHKLVDQQDRDLWSACQEQMVIAFDSDNQAKDLARVLRLPGYYNHKRQCEVLLLSAVPLAEPRSIHQLATALFGQIPKRQFIAPDLSSSTSLDQYIEQVVSGVHLHGPLRALMMINANAGLDKQLNKINMLGLIHSCPDELRKQQALRDLDAMLTATYNKKADEEVDAAATPPLHIPELPKIGIPTLDWPPGMMGELAKAVYDFSILPNRAVSIITALGFTAGIAGRKYNVSKSGCNLYITLLMNTGTGKDVIQNFTSRVLSNTGMYGDTGLRFLGSIYYTSAKGLRTDLREKPSMLVILTEAGLINKSDAGDKSSFLRATLDIYTKSGKYQMVGKETFSDIKNSNEILYAPALSIIHESTPQVFKETIGKRNSYTSGEFARNWLFELNDKRPPENFEHGELRFSTELNTALSYLLDTCYAAQQYGVPDVIDIAVPLQYRAFSEQVRERINELYDRGENDAAACQTRSVLKVLKVAALLAILDSLPTSSDIYMSAPIAIPVITDAHWNWAVQLYEFEQKILPRMLRVDDIMSAPLIAAIKIIHKLLTDENINNNDNLKSTVPYRKYGIFTESPFKQLAHQSRAIQQVATQSHVTNQQSGAQRILKYMTDEGLLERLTNDQLKRYNPETRGVAKTIGYRVTQLLKDRAADILTL